MKITPSSPSILSKMDSYFVENFGSQLSKMHSLISNANRIVLISHQKPDGDTSGSAMAMAYALESFGKKVTLYDEDPLADEFHFIPKASEYIHTFDINTFDLAIAFDGGTYKMFGLTDSNPELFDKTFPLINIDHHLSNEMYGSVNIVNDTVASTTIMVSKIFRALNWNITPEIATCLMLGLYTDTGSLQHSNATPETFREASFLLRKGADLGSIAKYVFQTKKVETLKLWGRILSRLSKNHEGIPSAFVRDKDFEETGTTQDDLTGVVDYLNSVPDSPYSILLTERKDGKVKGSLRTLHEDIDLTQVAGKMGGGGHRKASGFTVKGNLHVTNQWYIDQADKTYPRNFEAA